MKICVLSGRYPIQNHFLSSENHRVYCSHHDYTYINCNWPTTSKNRYLNKIHFLKYYITLFDLIFWIDDDAFFLDIDKSLDEFIPTGNNFLSICKSPSNKKITTVFSSGSFMISCSKGEEFVNAILESNLEKVKKWWKPEYGYFTNGDQDIMVYLYLTDDRFKGKIKLFDHNKFNSRIHDLEKEARIFLLHFTGSLNNKKRLYKSAQSKLAVGKLLLPDGAFKDYSIIDTSIIRYKLANVYYKLKNSLSQIIKH